jgi:hypothetical protein
MLTILATQEAEIRKIKVQSQPRQTDPILKKTNTKNRGDGVAQGISPEFKPKICKVLMRTTDIIVHIILSF